MTRPILALLASGSILAGVGVAQSTHCFAMAPVPQYEWVDPTQPVIVHKKPTHKAPHKAHAPQAPKVPHTAPTGPVEPLPPVMAPQLPQAPKDSQWVLQPRGEPIPPKRETYLERGEATLARNHRELWWVGRILGSLLIGGALGLIYFAGTKVYAGYKGTKTT